MVAATIGNGSSGGRTGGGYFLLNVCLVTSSATLLEGWQDRTALIMISITVNVIIYCYYPAAPRDPHPWEFHSTDYYGLYSYSY